MTKRKAIEAVIDKLHLEYMSAPQNKATLRAVERRTAQILRLPDDEVAVIAGYNKDGDLTIDIHVDRGSKWSAKLRNMGAKVVQAGDV